MITLLYALGSLLLFWAACEAIYRRAYAQGWSDARRPFLRKRGPDGRIVGRA